MKTWFAFIVLIFSQVLFTSELVASEQALSKLIVSGAYVQANIPGSDNTTGYMKLKNPNDTDVVIVGAETKVSSVTELHTHEIHNDRMQMRQVKSIRVKANDEVVLSQNGYHLMLIGLKQRIKPDEVISATLLFDDKSSQTIEMTVVDARKHYTERHEHHH